MKMTKENYKTISAIASRALTIMPNWDKMSVEMDIEAVHESNPLRLADFLAADDFNFAHDIFGIAHHLNRKTRKLEDCFLPRFTA
jgi:hypothetical protein